MYMYASEKGIQSEHRLKGARKQIPEISISDVVKQRSIYYSHQTKTFFWRIHICEQNNRSKTNV